MTSSVSFTEFFHALWESRDPFPWQRMLAERGAAGEWPEAISLPTASGKTACLDAAVYSLAARANMPTAERKASRRIWFVVDRRIVVDEAHRRATQIANKLASASDGPLKVVADRLRSLTSDPDACTHPLAVARLRGGAARDDSWAYDPTQPAILCSTIDQIGSSLLFRSYGHDQLTAPIWAGLTAHDSLILLDEAHCAVPFLQTLRAIRNYRSGAWASEPIETPFGCTVFSATLPPALDATISAAHRLPRDAQERASALDHPLLEQRLSTPKPAILVVAPKASKDDPRSTLAAEIAKHTLRHLDGHLAGLPGIPRIVSMTNRVATAQAVVKELKNALSERQQEVDVVLLTGRLRPLERDALVARWSPILRSNPEKAADRPVIVVTTQCLEVGADFSFDALVTECASLDALRQRFGRLDRLGTFRRASATLIIAEADTKEPKAENEDPIYGRALFETWQWLRTIGSRTEGRRASIMVDFSIRAMDAHIADAGAKRLTLIAPSPDAPVLLPAHLDLLCQTSPHPSPEPDISLFLHGKQATVPDVRVLWRADLPEDAARNPQARDLVLDLLTLVPPTAIESIAVPLPRLRAWLADHASSFEHGDVDGQRRIDNDPAHAPGEPFRLRVPFFVLWAGTERSRVTTHLGDIRPGQTVVLPASAGLEGLAQASAAECEGLGTGGIDLAEPATLVSRPRAILRLRRDLWAGKELSDDFCALLAAGEPEVAEEFDQAEFRARWEAVLHNPPATPRWLGDVVTALGRTPQIERPAFGHGIVLIGPQGKTAAIDEDYADETDARSRITGARNAEAITLGHHLADVASAAQRFASACLPAPHQSAVALAAPLHDLGKLDPRFQVMLQNGDEAAAEAAMSARRPLAKSTALPRRFRRRHEVAQDQQLPRGFRHEFLSLQLAERLGLIPGSAPARELALHLIASHHGHARPTPPDSRDTHAPTVDLTACGLPAVLDHHARLGDQITLISPLGARVANRFWSLVRRHGWWGLAYVETTFRLADWYASRKPSDAPQTPPTLLLDQSECVTSPAHHLTLPAIDAANPLGFIAALGVLRTVSQTRPALAAALSWVSQAGRLVPLLTTNLPLDAEELISVLVERLATERAFPSEITGNPERQKLKIQVEELRDHLLSVATCGSPFAYAAFWSAFFGETSPHPKDGSALKTRFDFHSGQMKIVENVAILRKQVDAEALRHTLFDGWRYVPRPSLRWDPLDEKRLYALQANDPSNKSRNPILTDIGANLLAVEGLHYFPMIPDRFGSQAGFNHGRYATEWSWPVWSVPLRSDSVLSLLHTRNKSDPNIRFFQSRMAESGKGYRSFSPGRPL